MANPRKRKRFSKRVERLIVIMQEVMGCSRKEAIEIFRGAARGPTDQASHRKPKTTIN